MPYIQIYIKGKRLGWFRQITLPHDTTMNEDETRKELAEVRDHFPLQQSEGVFYRMNPDSVLFEQPEHHSLTLEQEIWLEQHGYDALGGVNFYWDRSEGCRVCGLPFDGVPEGYIGGPNCHHTGNPYRVTKMNIPCSLNESRYLTHVSRSLRGNSDYVRQMTLTLASLVEQAQDDTIITELCTPDAFSSTVAHFSATHTCADCKQPFSQCSCWRDHFPISTEFTFQEYSHLQTLAEKYGLTVETFILQGLVIAAVQRAVLSRSAAYGHVLSYDFANFLHQQEEPELPSIQIGKQRLPQVASFGGPDGSRIPARMYHLFTAALQLSKMLPALSERIIDLLTGLHTLPPSPSYLSWCKELLKHEKPTTFQQATLCTDQDIRELELASNQQLPQAYREFLAWMGYGSGAFMQYLSCFYPTLLAHQQSARVLLQKDASPAHLPDDAFVFYLQANDHFAFFCTSEGEDPPVYAHKRDWRIKPFQKIFYHFSDFLAVQLALYLNAQSMESLTDPLEEGDYRGQFLAMQERVQRIIEQQQSTQE